MRGLIKLPIVYFCIKKHMVLLKIKNLNCYKKSHPSLGFRLLVLFSINIIGLKCTFFAFLFATTVINTITTPNGLIEYP